MALTNEFWDSFVEHHHSRAPGVWSGVFAEPFADMRDVFDWLLLSARRYEGGDHRQRHRLYSSGESLPNLTERLSCAADLSVAGYLGRLERELGQVGLVVNEVQAAHPALWHRSIDFLRPLYARIGIPAGGALLDLFSGSYEKGFFGVHKDDQDVFTIVLEGRKRLLLWPFEAFEDRPEAEGSSRQASWDLGHLDVASLRSDAIVLEGEPGDLLYWPSSYWHVAEAVRPREHVTTFSLGLFRHPAPLHGIALAVQELVDEGFASLSDCVPHPSAEDVDLNRALEGARDATRFLLESPAFAERHDARLLERITGFGFREVPDPLPSEPLEPTAWVSATCPQPIAWVRIDDDILWSANGYAFRFPFHSGLVRLFSRVCEGREERVADWMEVATTAPSSAELSADTALHVIGMLLRHHAIRRIDR